MTVAPSSAGATLTQMHGPGGVCRAAFVTRFSTMRSSFGGSTESTSGSSVELTSRSVERVEGLDGARGRGSPRSTVRYCGSTMPRFRRSMSRRSFSSRSSFRAFNARRSSEVAPIGLGHVRRAFEGEREPEDRRQRAAELVGDRREERVLHLVERPQTFGGVAFPTLRITQGLLGELALGDVHQHALGGRRARRRLRR